MRSELTSDVFTKSKRSDVMSRIRSRDNKDTELALVKLLRLHQITGWRRHQPIFGKPDFIFRKQKIALFVDGCFWHGCPRCYKRPKSNRKFWDAKAVRNQIRDRRVNRVLRQSGWLVLRIWEHDLANGLRVSARINKACVRGLNRLQSSLR
ncbi:MAG TPA: very short patch repair endonuclease [Verrucomicrobiae bacterium]|nr:very short patch repair endonuclease [Verrucomicrobiae bacterium]